MNRSISMCLFSLTQSPFKEWWKKVYRIWLGSLNRLSRLHKRLCGNQALMSTTLSTDRALRTSLFCKYICFHISYTWYLPPHFIHVYVHIFSCCSFLWYAFTEASWVLRIQQWISHRRIFTMLYFHFGKSWKMLVLFCFVFPHLDGIIELNF